MAAAAPILGQIAINLAVGLAASALSAALQPSGSETQSAQTGKVRTRRAFQQVRVGGEDYPVAGVVGHYPIAGQLIYANQYGSADQYTQLVFRIGYGEHQALTDLLVDGKPVTLSGSNASGKGKSVQDYRDTDGTDCLWIKTYSGADGQAADPELVANAQPSSRWTSSDTLTGQAYAIVTMRTGRAGVFDSRIPEFTFIWKGMKFYDWRKDSTQLGGSGSHRFADRSTWEWTDNPAVIKRHFRRGYFINSVRVLGMGLSDLFNDPDYYTAAANICDETITDPDTETTYTRYAFNGVLSDDVEPLDVMSQLDQAMVARSFSNGGADAPVPAYDLIPVMTLNDGDRVQGSAADADKFGAVSAKSTRWTGEYLNPNRRWKQKQYSARTNAELEAVIGRRDVVFDQLFEIVPERAQCRAEIYKNMESFGATRKETFGPVALQLRPGDAVLRDCEWGSMLMKVIATERLPGNIGATITLREWDNSIVPGGSDSIFLPEPDDGADAATPTQTLSVSGISMTSTRSVGNDGNQRPYIAFEWDDITDQSVDKVLIRVWPTSETENEAIDQLVDPHLASFALVGPLAGTTSYECKLIPIRSDLAQCVWSPAASVTTLAEVIGQNSWSPMLQEWRDWLGQSIDQLRADIEAGMLELVESSAATQIEQDSIRQSIGATVETAKSEITAQYLRKVSAIASDLGGAISRVETLEVGLDDLGEGLSGTSQSLSALTNRVETTEQGIVANAEAVTAVSVEVNGVNGNGRLSLKTDYTPEAGFDLRMGWQLSLESTPDVLRTAGQYFELNGSGGRMLQEADKHVFLAGGEVVALFEAGKATIDNAVVAELTADNIKAKSIDADDILIDGTLVTDLIKNNAVTVGSSGSSGNKTVNGPNNWKTLISKSITVTDGARLTVFFNCKCASTNSGVPVADFQLRRGSSTIDSKTYYVDDVEGERDVIFITPDDPGNGSKTFSVRARVRNSSNSFTVENIAIHIEMAKR